MVIAFNAFECYKKDVLGGVVKGGGYATTVRRVAVDFAAKVLRSGRKVIMKVTESTMKRLDLKVLWELSEKVSRLVT